MARKTVVLSIDWDYFFPDTAPYDWGHSEDMSIFFDMLWAIRAGNHDIMNPSGPPAIETMWPSGHGTFWPEAVDSRARPRKLFVAESHRSILELVGDSKNLVVHNVDAHHDLGYTNKPCPPNCGNWVLHLISRGQVSEFHQHYPEWRKDSPETLPSLPEVTVSYEPPHKLRPNLIFLCRSSCWTPSWADKFWMNFQQGAFFRCLGSECLAVDYVMKPRQGDEATARQHMESQKQLLADHMKSKQPV